MRRDEDLEKKIQERISISKDDIVNLDIVLEDGRRISHVGMKEREVIIYGCRTIFGCVGGVATRSEYREKGLATRLMNRSVQRLDEDQGDVMLVSGDRDLYRRRGCVAAAPTYRFNVTREDVKKSDGTDIHIVLYEEKYLLDIVNIYQKEPVRFHRSLREFQALLERRTPAPFWNETDVLILRSNGESLGYVVTQIREDEKRGKAPIMAIAEYAGDRSIITRAIKSLFDKYGMVELMFFVPEHDVEFLHILKQRGIQGERRNLGGHTFKIVNLPRLMNRFANYMEERVGKDVADSLGFTQKEDKFSITYKENRLELDGESLVRILFGTHDGAEKDIISGAGKMAEILRSLFPIPFLWPGLNSH